MKQWTDPLKFWTLIGYNQNYPDLFSCIKTELITRFAICFALLSTHLCRLLVMFRLQFSLGFTSELDRI